MITIVQQQCQRCGYLWVPRVTNPVTCPSCKSRIWARVKEENAIPEHQESH